MNRPRTARTDRTVTHATANGPAFASSLLLACAIWAIAGARIAHATNAPAAGEKLAQSSDCFSCHAVGHKVVGPAFADIALRYRGQPDAALKLEAKIKAGGAGNWGDVPMTPHPDLAQEQLVSMVSWVLSLRGHPAAHEDRVGKTYSYTLPDGSKVALDFPLLIKGHEVSDDVFAGWEQFNSYCFRCHGEDATGSAYAPDLRHSLNGGMTRSQFISKAVVGNPAKGMPTWAGFFTAKEIGQIYEYVKGRSLGLVPAGRPASSTG